MYAVVETGGKQYRAAVGDVLTIEKLPAEVGEEVIFDRVLLVRDEDNVRVGTPTVDGALVKGTVARQGRGPKLIIFKMKRRKNYRRKTGHRQHQTQVRITAIEG